ncbi:uncharacterized protein BROUX77_002222 [Berkeleyomyces rouxiae]|uniref:uncharacterized protein n=1 Tax=Berkeleyomyces rouxiae TaxID=2035830 RepID=UPI003B7EA657
MACVPLRQWGLLATDIPNPGLCIEQCRSRLTHKIAATGDLAIVCAQLNNNNASLIDFYCCDSAQCGVSNNEMGQDPTVSWLVSSCQSLGFSNVLDPADPEPNVRICDFEIRICICQYSSANGDFFRHGHRNNLRQRTCAFYLGSLWLSNVYFVTGNIDITEANAIVDHFRLSGQFVPYNSVKLWGQFISCCLIDPFSSFTNSDSRSRCWLVYSQVLKLR